MSGAAAGVNYCGRWVSVPRGQRERYGWETRLVCNRKPHNDKGRHRSRAGWTWPDGGRIEDVRPGAVGGAA